MKNRRKKMQKAGALCVKPTCRSHDVRYTGKSEIHWYPRPTFLCGSCGSEWTSGNDGKPYIDFAIPYEEAKQVSFKRTILFMDEEYKKECLRRNSR